MSEEERNKAYQFLQELDKNGYKYTANGREIYIVENVFNKIDQLQKEIEELKKHKEHEEEYINGEVFSAKQMHYIDEHYIDKDKIRDKIKELEEDREKVRNIYEPSDDDGEFIQTYQILVLKELLEEE